MKRNRISKIERINKPDIAAQRVSIETELASINPLNDTQKKLFSAEGFTDYFLRMQDLYRTQIEAYERLEEEHSRVFGFRKHSEKNSFMIVLRRFLLKHKGK